MAKTTIDYKSLNAELDEILEKLQASDIDVDEALEAYEKGMEITKKLEDYLKNAENKIKKVKSDWNKKSTLQNSGNFEDEEL